MPYKASYEEDGFLRQLGVGPEEGEPLADNCSLVLVWHTQTYNTYRQGYVFIVFSHKREGFKVRKKKVVGWEGRFPYFFQSV